MSLAQRNATLLKVERHEGTATGGYREDYDRPATDPDAGAGGKDEWTGRTSVYWIERRRRVTNGNDSDVILERSVILDGDLPNFAFIENDTVTVEHGGEEKTGRVAVIEKRAMPGVPPSVRLTLEDA